MQLGTPDVPRIVQAGDAETVGAGFDWGHLAVVAAWGVAAALVTLRWFRWAPRQG